MLLLESVRHKASEPVLSWVRGNQEAKISYQHPKPLNVWNHFGLHKLLQCITMLLCHCCVIQIGKPIILLLSDDIMTFVYCLLLQKGLPHPGFVLGRLPVRQHERVHCRDRGGWASSSIPLYQSPDDKALIKWTSAALCTISVTVQAASRTDARLHASPAAVTTHRTKHKTDLKHLLSPFQTAECWVSRDQNHWQAMCHSQCVVTDTLCLWREFC